MNERLENKIERLNGLMAVSGCLGNIICCEVISFLFCDRSRDARLLHGKKTDKFKRDRMRGLKKMETEEEERLNGYLIAV